MKINDKKNELREKIEPLSKVARVSDILRNLNITTSNYYAFMKGENSRLSVDKLESIYIKLNEIIKNSSKNELICTENLLDNYDPFNSKNDNSLFILKVIFNTSDNFAKDKKVLQDLYADYCTASRPLKDYLKECATLVSQSPRLRKSQVFGVLLENRYLDMRAELLSFLDNLEYFESEFALMDSGGINVGNINFSVLLNSNKGSDGMAYIISLKKEHMEEFPIPHTVLSGNDFSVFKDDNKKEGLIRFSGRYFVYNYQEFYIFVKMD